jgi:hypothetical protein
MTDVAVKPNGIQNKLCPRHCLTGGAVKCLNVINT